MRVGRTWIIATAVAAVAFTFGASATVVAQQGSQEIDKCTTGCSGNQVTQVKAIASGPGSFVTTSSEFVNVPSAARTISVSEGGALLVARFQGDVACGGSGQGCSVTFLIDSGAVSTLTAPANFEENPATSAAQSRSIERSVKVSGQPGQYVVQVQAKTGAGSSIDLSNWNLTVERIAPAAQRFRGPPDSFEQSVEN